MENPSLWTLGGVRRCSGTSGKPPLTLAPTIPLQKWRTLVEFLFKCSWAHQCHRTSPRKSTSSRWKPSPWNKQVSDINVSELTRAFAAHCTEIQERIRALEFRALPIAVVFRASRKAHRVANAFTTMCGWHWSSDQCASNPIDSSWEGDWRRRRLAYADRLERGGVVCHGSS